MLKSAGPNTSKQEQKPDEVSVVKHEQSRGLTLDSFSSSIFLYSYTLQEKDALERIWSVIDLVHLPVCLLPSHREFSLSCSVVSTVVLSVCLSSMEFVVVKLSSGNGEGGKGVAYLCTEFHAMWKTVKVLPERSGQSQNTQRDFLIRIDPSSVDQPL